MCGGSVRNPLAVLAAVNIDRKKFIFLGFPCHQQQRNITASYFVLNPGGWKPISEEMIGSLAFQLLDTLSFLLLCV